MADFECRWPVSDGEDWNPVEAIDPQDAAERYAANTCNDDSGCYDDFQLERGQNVEVRLAGSEVSLIYRVRCEFDPTFRALRVEAGS